MSLIYNATFDKNTRKLSFEDKAGNEIYSFTVPERVTVDSVTKPLTFRATQDGSTVSLTKYGSPKGTFQTSSDGGNTWSDYSMGTAITLNTGDEVSFRAKSNRTTMQSRGDYFYFKMTGKIEAWHNVMSLYRTNDFATYNTTVFLAFYQLFMGCKTSLVKAPVLPATTLDDYCYEDMFYGCTSLTKAPELHATTLAQECCKHMFSGCTSLAEAPTLPATALDYGCYTAMFYGCTSLTKAPVLPATTLANRCYMSMFSGCTSLTKAPVLPATTLDDNCYMSMFDGCRSLNEVHCYMPPSHSSSKVSSYASNWLRNVSSTGTFYTNSDANWTSGASGIPTSWTRVPERGPAVDNVTKPLTFKATQDGSTVKLTKYGSPTGAFQTSRDGGNTWADYTIGTDIPLNTGDEVSFRAGYDRTSAQTRKNYFYFGMTGEIEAWHNVMSMYRTNDFATYESVVNYEFYHLFDGCTSLTKAPRLPATTLAQDCYSYMFMGCTSLAEAPYLPATNLAHSCYYSMFRGCTSLTKAPDLPATTLANDCYGYMFYGCTSLTKAPDLSATTLVYDCYYGMFGGCTSLTKAPVLPATTLATYCYYGMFEGCTSLTEASELPATALAVECYNSMFKGCTSLVKAPELPATTLANNCYSGMFNGCSSLNEVRCKMSSTISAEDISSTYAKSWLSGVASTGTFYTNADANWSSGSVSGIPEGWRRVNA